MFVKGKKLTDVFEVATGVKNEQALPLDIALHDLAGVILDKPVYELLGRTQPYITHCYSGMIYFDDIEPPDNPAGLDKIVEECQYDYDYGYRQFKLKIGRGNKWMPKQEGLQRDIEVTKLVAENFPDCDILVDANNGYSVEDTIAYLKGIGNVKLFWIEEPFHETAHDYKKLKEWLTANNIETLLADGEAKPDHDLLRKLEEQKIINVHLPDIIGYGFTPWRKLMPELIRMGTPASPHAWGSLLKTYYIAQLAGGLGNTLTIEGVTCQSEDVDFGDYKMEEGKLIPSSAPGFGMKLLKSL
jgi:L-alanine-DL-glutamate epimerase-like enolase superfamily enzyme